MPKETTCSICEEVCLDELQCSRCEYATHYTCALGFDPPDEFKNTESKVNFVCPPCLVGSSYSLLHVALEAHQKAHSSRRDSSPSAGSTPTDVVDISKSPTGPLPSPVLDNSGQSNHGETKLSFEAVDDQPDTEGTNGGSQGNTSTSASSSEPPPRLQNQLDPENLELPDPTMTPPHPNCLNRSKKLSYILSIMKHLPYHSDRVILGDSHLQGMEGKVVDNSDQIRVRSVSGLCIVGAVMALLKHKGVYRRIKSVGWVLGHNDAMHSEEHCQDDRCKYLRLLFEHSRRIFPHAKISVVLPFLGTKLITERYLSDLTRDFKATCPQVRILRPPSMRDKIAKKGVHLNVQGREAFTVYLRQMFAKPRQRVFDQNSGRNAQAGTSTAQHQNVDVHQGARDTQNTAAVQVSENNTPSSTSDNSPVTQPAQQPEDSTPVSNPGERSDPAIPPPDYRARGFPPDFAIAPPPYSYMPHMPLPRPMAMAHPAPRFTSNQEIREISEMVGQMLMRRHGHHQPVGYYY